MKLQIERGSVHEYIVPLKRSFATARKQIDQVKNHLIFLQGRMDSGELVCGTGEASARGVRVTSDPKGLEMRFFRRCLRQIKGMEINLESFDTAKSDIRVVTQQIAWIADEVAISDWSLKNAFSACRCGIEMALLDMTSRAMNVALADLLGRKRSHSTVTAHTFSLSDATSLKDRIRVSASSFKTWRLKGDSDLENTLDKLRQMQELATELKHDNQTFWLDFNESMTLHQTATLLSHIKDMAVAGRLAGTLIIEQPVPHDDVRSLCKLQDLAKQCLQNGLHVAVMADEALHTLGDWEELSIHGGCDAVNIKIQKTGGLLPALDLAARIFSTNPEVQIYLGSMVGASDITGYAIHQLACAVPRIDHNTTAPRTGLRWNVVNSPLEFEKVKNRRIKLAGTGLGTCINIPLLAPLIVSSSSQEPVIQWHRAVRDDKVFRFHYENPALFRLSPPVVGMALLGTACLKAGWSIQLGREDVYARRGKHDEIFLGRRSIGAAHAIPSEKVDSLHLGTNTSCAGTNTTLLSTQVPRYHALICGMHLLRIVALESASIIGDGAASIKELIHVENKLRKRSPTYANGSIRSRSQTLNTDLAQKGYTLQSVPAQAETIYFSGDIDRGAPYVARDVTETVHPFIVKQILEMTNAEAKDRPFQIELSITDPTRSEGEITIKRIYKEEQLDWMIFNTPHRLQSRSEAGYAARDLGKEVFNAMAQFSLNRTDKPNNQSPQQLQNQGIDPLQIVTVRMVPEGPYNLSDIEMKLAVRCSPLLILWVASNNPETEPCWLLRGEATCVATAVCTLDIDEMTVTQTNLEDDFLESQLDSFEPKQYRVSGLQDPKGYSRWLQSFARLHGLRGWCATDEHEADSLHCCLAFPHDLCTTIISILQRGPDGTNCYIVQEILNMTRKLPVSDFLRLKPIIHNSDPNSSP